MPSEHVLFWCRGPHDCAELPSSTQEKGRDWLPSPLWPRKEVETGCHPGQLPQEQLSLLVALTDRQSLPSWLVTLRQGLWPLLCPYASSLHSWKRNSPDVLGTKGVLTVEPLRIFSLPWGVSGAVKRMPTCWGSSLLRIQHGLWVRVACSHTSGEHVNHLLQLEEILSAVCVWIAGNWTHCSTAGLPSSGPQKDLNLFF